MLQQLRTVSRQFLGLNRRDRDLVARYNPRRLAHDTIHKLHTKTLLDACDIPVAETLAVYRFPHELRRFVQDAADWTDFVMKPAQGTGGGGVIVVAGREAEAFLSLGGQTLRPRTLENHLSDILNGVYSLNHRYDEAFVERRLRAHPRLARLSFQGLPDIRVIVFQGIPLMAMLRLATRRSEGRALGEFFALVPVKRLRRRLYPGCAGVPPLAPHRARAVRRLGQPLARRPAQARRRGIQGRTASTH